MRNKVISVCSAGVALLLLTTPVCAQGNNAAQMQTNNEQATLPDDLTEEERGYTHIGLYETLPTGETGEMALDTFALYSYNTANADTAYFFLRQECGMNAAQAAGVMASLYSESHFEPTAYNGADNGGISYGISQWHDDSTGAGRYQMLREWCDANGYDYTTLGGQLHYLQYEITQTWEKQVYQRIDSDGNCFGTVADSSDGAWTAGYTWSRYYGRGAAAGWYARGDYAREFYALYADKAVNPTVDVTQVTAFVTRLYSVCLGRVPDANGLQDWVERITNGTTTGIQTAAGFVFSNEFRAKDYSNEDYIKQLYRAFLGRESDADGLKNWLNELSVGISREGVFNGFALSPEFDALCKTYGIVTGSAIDASAANEAARVNAIKSFVTRLYNVCLDREPDTAGLTNWVNALQTKQLNGRGVAYGFVFSPEFAAKNLSDEDYVEHLYKAFFGRGSDAAGKANWLNHLASGSSRSTVFDGFVGSDEFSDLCAAYGLERG